MLDEFNKVSDTVASGYKVTGDWLHCKSLEGLECVRSVGFVCGKNKFGQFMALVADNGNAYYLPKWYLSHVAKYSAEDVAFIKSLKKIKVVKRAYENTYTYDVFLLDEEGKPVHI